MRVFAPIICLLLSAPSFAQRGGGMPAAHMAFPAGRTFQRGITSISRPAFPGEFARFRGAGLVNLGYPFWGEGGSEISSQPNIIVLQNGAEPAPQRMAEPEPKPADPLLIELQGDRYVRVGSKSAGSTGATPAVEQAAEPASAHAALAPLPPTVFVYRDGHREESSDYSIISGTIYAHTDYYATGAWSKQIPVTDLDLPASLRANQERGVKLVLPGSPNEVVTRP